jgi:hypothetical protein
VAEIELLIAELPTTRLDATVDGCVAAIWRVRASRSGESVRFECRWASEATYTDVGPESGQALDAQTWTGGNMRVTIGTLDPDALVDAAREGWLPARWANLIDPNTVVYLSDGFDLVFPPLQAGEHCQAHFVVAWAPYPAAEEDVSTWLAVNRSPSQLSQLLAPAV